MHREKNINQIAFGVWKLWYRCLNYTKMWICEISDAGTLYKCVNAQVRSVSLQSDIYWPGHIIQRLYDKTSSQTYLEPDSLDVLKYSIY